MLAREFFGRNPLPAGEAFLDVVVPFDGRFPTLPAEEDDVVFDHAVEVDESGLDALDDDVHLSELACGRLELLFDPLDLADEVVVFAAIGIGAPKAT